MPIRIVLNGFFRSGTTLLWDWFRRSIPEARCFYEPLHPDLERLARRERRSGRAHPDHRMLLWDEYNRLPSEVGATLMRAHPGRLGRDWHDVGPLFRFLDHFHELPGETILQPCRASPFLAAIAERYDAATVHIVRHPMDVFWSMRRTSSSSRSALRRLLFRFTWPVRADRGYDLRETARWLRAREAAPPADVFDDFLELLLFVWIQSNHDGIAGIERSDGTLIAYEELISDPERVRGRLARGLGRSMGPCPPLRPGSLRGFREAIGRRTLAAAERLGLTERLRALCATVESVTGQSYVDRR